MTESLAETKRRWQERYPGAVILPYEGAWPRIAESAFIAPTAVVIGNVTVGEEASVWYNATVRGDIAPVAIGNRSNVQDNTVVHVNMDAPVVVGNDVTIGHSAIIHGTTINDGTVVGMGAIVMSYSTIGRHCVIAAGALVTERTTVEDGSVMVGVPAKPRSSLDEAAQRHLDGIAGRYLMVAGKHRASTRGVSS
ncbi:MAG TPA: gamma carbonic anhydrase family protein [Thermomicrobiales bacterium]|nr:gamma carbonic anhydrase family protein [Thermomicrobiales bacterium]